MNKLKVLQKYNRLWKEAAQKKLGKCNNDKQDRYAMVINTLLCGGSLWHQYDYYVSCLREYDQAYAQRQDVGEMRTFYRKILAVIAEALVDLAEWRQGAVVSLNGYGFETFADRLKRKQRF